MSNTPWSLKNQGRFFQDWSNTGLLTTTKNSSDTSTDASVWANVPSIIGYLGNGITGSSTGVDPRTLTAESTTSNVPNLFANQTNPNTNTSGGVAEFEISDPVVALQGSGTAGVPYLELFLDTTGMENITFSALIRDIDGSTDNTNQQVNVQYRVGNSGAWTNVDGGYIVDATTGPSLATMTTQLNLSLPANAANQALVQIRIMTTNAPSNDEWVGIDNITANGTAITVPQPGNFAIANASATEGAAGTTTPISFNVTRTGGSSGASDIAYTVKADGLNGHAGSTDFASGTAFSGTVHFADGDAATKTITLNIAGDGNPEPNETFTVTLGTPTVGALASATATGTITNDDGNTVHTYDIQGLGHTSGWAGQSVNTSGVVTAVTASGFYLQDPTGDGNDATSDAVYVQVGSKPTVAVGNAITLTGTVTEYATGTGGLTITELTSPSAITVTAASVALPAAVVIATDGTGRAPPTSVIDDDSFASYDATTDGIDFYESLEGMRVTIKAPLVVANTTSGSTYVVASGGAGATGINDRSGISISAGDNNPEKIQIYDTSTTHTQGEVLNDVTGVVSYYGGEYEVIPTVGVTVATPHAALARETTSLVGTSAALSYASFNIENFTPRAQDYNSTSRPYSLDTKLQALSTEIVAALKSPDIIGLQEVQDNDGIGAGTDYTATQTAQLLIDAIAAAGGPTYKYVEVAPTANNVSGGESNGNIRNGFLYNPARVAYVDGSARALTDAAYNGTRKPLLADFTFNGQTFTAADVHSTSRGGSDSLFGATQPPTQAGDSARTAQASALKAYVDNVLANDPTHKFVVNGDFNGYYYEDALSALQAGNKLDNLYLKLPSEERYSYYFDGYYQAFDNILVSDALYAGTSFDVVHYNAGFTDGQSVTDHDQVVATIGLARAGGTAMAVADAFTTTAAALYRGTVLANDTGGDASLAVTAVNGAALAGQVRLASGALLTLAADGSYTYDPDGAFGGVASGQTTTDSFTYTETGGSTATVSVTITGLAGAASSSGNDMLGGTTGADTFDLSAGGNDTVSGGAGNDAFFFGAAFTAADRVNGGSGANDQIGLQGDYTGTHALVLAANTITNVEVIATLPGYGYDITTHDANVAAGQMLTIFGGNLGASDNLTFNGSAETDGAFRIFGGLGVDTLTGGAGDDAFFFGPGKYGASDVVHGGGGSNDQLVLDGNYTVTLDARADVETVVLLPGPSDDLNHFAVTIADGFLTPGVTRTVYATGVTTDVTISASGTGVNGALRILSGSGNDTLTGGAGADTIFGGLGADTLTGGGGADTFLYQDVAQSTPGARDTITDFTSGDVIDLTDIDANATTAADDAFAFIGDAVFGHHAGELRYEVASNGQVIVQGDVDGDGVADFAIALTITDGHTLTGGDFHL